MKIVLPEKVSWIINKLEKAGFEAYAVGGCVRDSILGREPADWDVTTSAKPEQVKELFSHTIDTGIQHGTVTVMLDHEGFEVTTYRIDGEYADARHPQSVSFTADLTEDLKRRDFTINAMAYNERSGLVDMFDGIGDMESAVVRCVGEAKERFSEDALRILRAVRFAAQLGFSIDEKTAAAAKLLACNLRQISAERIQTELVKLLVSPHPELLRTAYELGITAVILPEFDTCMETPQNNPYHCYSVGEHTIKSMEFVDEDKVLRLAMLFHDFGKPACRTTRNDVDHFYGHSQESKRLTENIMRRLKFDHDTMAKVKILVEYHDQRPMPDKRDIRRLINRVGKELFPSLLQVFGADILAKSSYKRLESLVRLDQVAEFYEEILRDQECLSLKELAVTGKDLIAEGMKPGKALGDSLQAMLEEVLEHPEHNDKEFLLRCFSIGKGK